MEHQTAPEHDKNLTFCREETTTRIRRAKRGEKNRESTGKALSSDSPKGLKEDNKKEIRPLLFSSKSQDISVEMLEIWAPFYLKGQIVTGDQ